MPQLRALLLDLDGTLVHSAPDLAAALNHTLESAGLPGHDVPAVTRMIGDGTRMLVSRGFAGAGRPVEGEMLDRWYRHFMEFYTEHVADLTRPYEGVVETLERLRAEGLRLAVCTNKAERPSHLLLERLGLAKYLDTVVGGDTPAGRKPDPGILLEALRRLGHGAAEAVMVGDTVNDSEAAKAAGVPCLVVTYGYVKGPPEDLGAARLLENFSELPEALAEMFRLSCA